MALGEIYTPSRLAFETAQAILEVKNPMAVNVAMGCTNNCQYPCYGPIAFKVHKEEWTNVRIPKKPCALLVHNQLKKGIKPEGVFMSFATDPLLKINYENTIQLCELLIHKNIRTAILSKTDILNTPEIRHGMTVVSKSEDFKKQWEPDALSIIGRIIKLRIASRTEGFYTWVSMEPYPTPEIWNQNIIDILEEIKNVNFIIYGRWNYDKRGSSPAAKEFYKATVGEFIDWCKSNGIRYHVKRDTMEFIKSTKGD
jgi:DNA repair photolyase